MAGGYGIEGNADGPYRAGSPFSLRRRASITFSGVTGISSIHTPSASCTAAQTAGGTGSSGPWPASLAPYGPSGSTVSTMNVSTSGMSRNVGDLYSSIDGHLWRPLRNVCSSISASPRPMYTLPSTWPSTRSGLIARPTSWAIQTLLRWTNPVRGSASKSTTQAEQLYAGLGP